MALLHPIKMASGCMSMAKRKDDGCSPIGFSYEFGGTVWLVMTEAVG